MYIFNICTQNVIKTTAQNVSNNRQIREIHVLFKLTVCLVACWSTFSYERD